MRKYGSSFYRPSCSSINSGGGVKRKLGGGGKLKMKLDITFLSGTKKGASIFITHKKGQKKGRLKPPASATYPPMLNGKICEIC